MFNPLLVKESLPLFDQIQHVHVEPAVDQILSNHRVQVEKLLNNTSEYTWENFVQPLEELDNDLSVVLATISHLNVVKDAPEFRKAYDSILPKVSEYYTELGQNEDLFLAFQTIANSNLFSRLNYAQQKIIKNALRDFKLSGITLSKDKKEKFKKLKKDLSELENQFGHNVLDATQGWHLHVTDIDQLKGLSEHTLKLMKEAAEKKGLKGFLVTLDYSTYHAVQSYAEDRELRRKVYEASATRASDKGPNANQWNNSSIMGQILKIRQAFAKLLEFNNYAEYSLATKMAKKTDKVMDFLLDLANRSQSMAKKEFEELKQFGRKNYGIEEVEAWDVWFLAEHLCKERYSVSQEELRPYFPENKVLEGLFIIVNRLFGIKIQEEFNFEKWHETVRLFSVYDRNGKLKGNFYIDLYSRGNKREGAWVSDCRNRLKSSLGKLQLPVAYLNTNFSPPEANKPALFTHDDVVTLFHEFGHCLHHVLTEINYSSISGNNGVEWDAVELPSQLLENWCWEEEAIKLISSHFETGAPLPEALLKKLREAKNFLSGMHMVRQLEFALFDFKIHLQPEIDSSLKIQEILNEVRKQVSVVPVPDFNRFQHTFSHIFAGGYAAGYYSYKWAEVLSSDVYEKFEEAGIFNSKVGEELLTTVLEQGGAKEAMELFIEFRGREPKIDALLRHSALTLNV